MKVYVHNIKDHAIDYDITSIDFCCSKMAKKVLHGIVTMSKISRKMQWFRKDLPLSYCNYCGEKIEAIQVEDKE